jgi:cardiolipin synthase
MIDATQFSLNAALTYLLHLAIVIGFSVRVIMRRRPVGVSLAWIAILFSVPLLGVMVYLLIGENRISERYIKRARHIRRLYLGWQLGLRERISRAGPEFTPQATALSRQAETLIGFPCIPGNRMELMEDFKAVFEAIIRDINHAQSSCHLEFYIWHHGGMTEKLQTALLDAAARGVTCRLLVDAIGSKPFLGSPALRTLRAAGIQVAASLPAGLLGMFLSRADLRNHRKLIVIDGQTAYTGSQNMVDPRYFKQDAGVGQWVDAMVRVQGPAVEALAGSFIQDWEIVTGTGMAELRHTHDVRPTPEKGMTALQVVPSGPAFLPMAIHQLLLSTLYAAREELIITTPYFIPDEALMAALTGAASRGVRVTLIIPAQNDSRLVHYASRSFYAELLAAGVRIAGFTGGLLHTKSINADGEICVFGSVNLDMRSIWINFELSLIIYDRDFIGSIRRMQDDYLARSQLFDADEWGRRPRRERFLENAIHLASPLL